MPWLPLIGTWVCWSPKKKSPNEPAGMLEALRKKLFSETRHAPVEVDASCQTGRVGVGRAVADRVRDGAAEPDNLDVVNGGPSTIEPEPRSEAMKRSCMLAVGVTMEERSKLAWIQPPSVPAPVGPTLSTSNP